MWYLLWTELCRGTAREHKRRGCSRAERRRWTEWRTCGCHAPHSCWSTDSGGPSSARTCSVTSCELFQRTSVLCGFDCSPSTLATVVRTRSLERVTLTTILQEARVGSTRLQQNHHKQTLTVQCWEELLLGNTHRLVVTRHVTWTHVNCVEEIYHNEEIPREINS